LNLNIFQVFPCISTGVYGNVYLVYILFSIIINFNFIYLKCLGYPHEEAAIIVLDTIRDFLEHDHNLVILFFLFYLLFYLK